MANWNASQYLKFEKQRTQPARDLLAHLQELKPKTAADIGCGPGNSTSLLADFFPDTKLIGIDSILSPEVYPAFHGVWGGFPHKNCVCGILPCNKKHPNFEK